MHEPASQDRRQPEDAAALAGTPHDAVQDHRGAGAAQGDTDRDTLRAIFDNSPEFVGLVSTSGVLLRANRTALEFIGRAEADVVGREFWTTPWWDHSPDVQRSLRDGIERAASGQGARFEVTHRGIDGEVLEVDFSLAPVIGDDGEVRFITAHGRDITERKRVERAHSEAERRLAAIIEFLPDPTFVVDRERRVIAWNRALEAMTGVRHEDILGRGDSAYGAPFYGEPRMILIDLVFDDDPAISSRYEFVERRGDTLLTEAWVPAVFDGRGAFLAGTASPLRDENGVVYGAIESLRDITKRKVAEGALREAERRLAAIIEFLPDATFVIDSERRVIAWNRALEEMTGVCKADILGRGDFAYGAPFYGEPRPIVVDLVWQDDLDISSRYDYVERRGDTLLAEVWVPSLYGGRGAFVTVAASPLRDENGIIRGAIESVRDVTERKQAQESLRHAYDGLEAQVAQRTAELEVANEALTRMTLVDGLTGIANRRSFDDVLEREWRRAAREGVALALIMLDIDFFKSYNDAYGHLAGDDCLRRVAGALAAVVRRPADLAARYGGEEFAVVLPQTDSVGALAVAEELRERVEALGIAHPASSVSDRITVSLGAVSVVPDGDAGWLVIIAAADCALYRAKHDGRNRVCGEAASGA